MKKNSDKKAVTVTEAVVVAKGSPQTVEEVNAAIAELEGRLQATHDDFANMGYIDAAKMWRNAILRTEESINAGQHDPDALKILRERLRDARGHLDRLTADIELLPERQRLDVLRQKLELEEARRIDYGEIDLRPVYMLLPEPFGASMSGFQLPEGTPPAVVKLFSELAAPVDALAERIERWAQEVRDAALLLADLSKPIDEKVLKILRECRITLADALKVYITATADAYAKLLASNTPALVADHNAALDAEAELIIAGKEKAALEIGLDPEAARAGAQKCEEAGAVLARRVDPQAVSNAEAGFFRILARKAGQARAILENELAALA